MNYGVTDILQLIGSISLFLFAMKTMSEGIQKATGSALRSFLNVVTTNKYLGLLSGFLITGIIQSSSATTVMVVSFVNAGLLSLKQSIGVIMGANMGTTVTSWLINGLGFSELGLMIFALPAIGLRCSTFIFRCHSLESVGRVFNRFWTVVFRVRLDEKLGTYC